MRLVKLVANQTGKDFYVNPSLVASICRFLDGSTAVRVGGEDVNARGTVAEVAAEIERQTSGGDAVQRLQVALERIQFESSKHPDRLEDAAGIVGAIFRIASAALERDRPTY